jgi:hypothetical protein
MLGQTSGMSLAHQNKKNVPISVRSQTLMFRGTAPTFTESQSFKFLSVGTVKSLVYSAPIENKETLYQLNFDACQTLRSCPGICERV